jgi:hypothetical protein
MTGEWFVEVWAPKGRKALEKTRFEAFESLHAYVIAFKEQETNNILLVHLPSRASNDERRQIIELGASLI